MLSKLRMSSTILTFWSVSNAVRESGLEPIKISTDHIGMFVGDDAGQVLPYSLAQDSRLAEMHREALLHQNRSGVR